MWRRRREGGSREGCVGRRLAAFLPLGNLGLFGQQLTRRRAPRRSPSASTSLARPSRPHAARASKGRPRGSDAGKFAFAPSAPCRAATSRRGASPRRAPRRAAPRARRPTAFGGGCHGEQRWVRFGVDISVSWCGGASASAAGKHHAHQQTARRHQKQREQQKDNSAAPPLQLLLPFRASGAHHARVGDDRDGLKLSDRADDICKRLPRRRRAAAPHVGAHRPCNPGARVRRPLRGHRQLDVAVGELERAAAGQRDRRLGGRVGERRCGSSSCG